VSEEGERNVEEISLKEFQVEEIREFVKSALGLGKLSDQVVVWIRKEVGGSPFLISEFIRPIVRRVRAGAYYDEEKLLQELKNVKFPKSVLDLYRQRVDTLDLNSLKILEILSAFDTPIYCRLLNQFDELREVNVRESLDKLRRSGIIDFSEFKELCSISQGKVREMVYEKVPEGRKRELHMRIGSLQERFHGNRVDDHAEEIASHFEKGGDAEKAFSYYLAAAERAASIHARTHARTLYEKTLELALVRDLSVVPELMGKVGHAYLLTADYEKAASVYKQLLDLRLTTSEKVDVLRELATVLERRGDFEEAIRYINQALELADETQKKVEILNELAIIYIRRARYDEADRICLQALELTQSKVILNERADAFNNLGIIHVNRNEPEYAEECFKMSLEAREEVGNKLKIALSYTNLGILSNRRGDYETARYYSKKALQLSEEVGDIRHVARCNNNLGIIAYDQTEYEESLIYYKKALDIFVRTDDKAGSSWSWYNVGELQFKLCEYEQSLKSLERCLELYRCLDDMQGLAEAYDQLGMVYFTLGMSNEAWDCARKAQQLIQTSRIQTETGHNMLLLATLYAMVSEWDRSEETFLKAADFFKETGDETERCWAISMLGGMFSQKREFQKAIKLMDETFQVCPQDAFLKMEILLNLGTAYQYLHDRQSVVFLQDAYSLSEQVTVSEVSWKICFALFREYQSRGLLTKAYEYGEKTLLVLRHILSKFTQPDLADAYLNSHNRNGVINYIDQVGKPSPEES
jgi:tetratricopeptide (TPR) repeat protein